MNILSLNWSVVPPWLEQDSGSRTGILISFVLKKKKKVNISNLYEGQLSPFLTFTLQPKVQRDVLPGRAPQIQDLQHPSVWSGGGAHLQTRPVQPLQRAALQGQVLPVGKRLQRRWTGQTGLMLSVLPERLVKVTGHVCPSNPLSQPLWAALPPPEWKLLWKDAWRRHRRHAVLRGQQKQRYVHQRHL